MTDDGRRQRRKKYNNQIMRGCDGNGDGNDDNTNSDDDDCNADDDNNDGSGDDNGDGVSVSDGGAKDKINLSHRNGGGCSWAMAGRWATTSHQCPASLKPF